MNNSFVCSNWVLRFICILGLDRVYRFGVGVCGFNH